MKQRNQQLWWWLGATALFGLIVVIYQRSLALSFVQDDWIFLQRLVAHDSLGDWLALAGRDDHFYRPVPRVLVLGVEYHLFGLNARWFHFVQLMVHALNSFLIVRLTWRLTNVYSTAWAAGFLYAIHQALYLAITWIAGIQELMLVLGMLCCLLCYLSFVEHGGWWWYGLALAAATWALFSKDMAVVVPAWIALLAWYKRPLQAWRHSVRDVAGFTGLVALYLLIRSAKASVDIAEGAYKLSFAPRTIGSNLQLYVADILAMRLRESINVLAPVWFALFLLIICVALWWLPVQRRLICVVLGWFGTGILPVLALTTQNYSYYLAMPLIGIVILAAIGLTALGCLMARGINQPRLTPFMVALLLLAATIPQHDQRQIRWQADDGGIRFKSLLSQAGLEQLQAQHQLIATTNTIYVRNITEEVYWAWGQGRMFQAVYPNLEEVHFALHTPADALEAHDVLIFDFEITPELIEAVKQIRPN